jgi:hypothetical protein
MLQMLLEDTKINALIGECYIVVRTFLSVESRLREMGTFRGMRWDTGRAHSVRKVRMKDP